MWLSTFTTSGEFSKHLLNTYYVPDIVLGLRGIKLNKQPIAPRNLESRGPEGGAGIWRTVTGRCFSITWVRDNEVPLCPGHKVSSPPPGGSGSYLGEDDV